MSGVTRQYKLLNTQCLSNGLHILNQDVHADGARIGLGAGCLSKATMVDKDELKLLANISHKCPWIVDSASNNNHWR